MNLLFKTHEHMKDGNMNYKNQSTMRTGYSPMLEQRASSASRFFYETSAIKNNVGDVMKDGVIYMCNQHLI